MKQFKILILFSLLLIGCSYTEASIPSVIIPPSVDTSEATSTQPSFVTSPSINITSPSVNNPSPSVNNPSPSVYVPSPSPSVTPSTPDVMLPIGNKKLPAPNNINNKTDITEWVERDLFDEIPTNWKHIYGNNVTNGSFYAESHGGGVKFDQLYKGLQSEAFTPFTKLELRFYFSSVNNCGQKPDKNAEFSFVIYGYDQSTNLIYQSGIEIDAIKTTTAGNYVKHYITNDKVCYFEIRLAAFPYKSNQCYNTGIDKISIKGWPHN